MFWLGRDGSWWIRIKPLRLFSCYIIVNKLFYLSHFTFQYCSRSNLSSINIHKEQDWFISLMKHVGHTLPKSKTHVDLLKEVFSVWEEFMLDIFEDYAAIGGKFKDFGQEGKNKNCKKYLLVNTTAVTIKTTRFSKFPFTTCEKELNRTFLIVMRILFRAVKGLGV